MRRRYCDIASEEHRNIERVLTLIQLQLDNLAYHADSGRVDLLYHAVSYMSGGFPLTVHTVSERIVLEYCTSRQREAAGLYRSLGREQSRAAELRGDFMLQLRLTRAGDLKHDSSLAESGTAYCFAQRQLMRDEERQLFPEARRWLTPLDWDEIHHRQEQRLPLAPPPELTGDCNLYEFLMTQPEDATALKVAVLP